VEAAEKPAPKNTNIVDYRTGEPVAAAFANGTVYQFRATVPTVAFWKVPAILDGVWIESADKRSLLWLSSTSGTDGGGVACNSPPPASNPSSPAGAGTPKKPSPCPPSNDCNSVKIYATEDQNPPTTDLVSGTILDPKPGDVVCQGGVFQCSATAGSDLDGYHYECQNPAFIGPPPPVGVESDAVKVKWMASVLGGVFEPSDEVLTPTYKVPNNLFQSTLIKLTATWDDSGVKFNDDPKSSSVDVGVIVPGQITVCGNIGVGSIGVTMMVPPPLPGRTLKWYAGTTLIGEGESVTINAPLTDGATTYKVCDSELETCCTSKTVNFVGHCNANGDAAREIKEAVWGMEDNCPANISSYLEFLNSPPLEATACYSGGANGNWKLRITKVTVDYRSIFCLHDGSAMNVEDANSIAGVFCDAVTNLKPDANGNPAYDGFYAKACESIGLNTGVDEFAEAFEGTWEDAENQIEAVTLPFVCGDRDTPEKAANDLLNLPAVKNLVMVAYNLAFIDWGYDRNNPQPTQGMKAERAACLNELVDVICDAFNPAANPPCPHCL